MSQASILEGRSLSQSLQKQMKEDLEKTSFSRRPLLVSLLVGQSPDSLAYTRNQEKVARKVGIEYNLCMLDQDTTTDALLLEVQKLNHNHNVDGIIIQQPLPRGIHSFSVFSSVSTEKDVDCVNPLTAGCLFQDHPVMIPPTPNAVMRLLDFYGIPLEGKDIVVLGRSLVVGKPLAMLLLHRNATVQICHSYTQNLDLKCSQADIVISAVGKPGLIRKDMIKKGGIVIDVGINVQNGKIVGDTCYDELISVASMITPVPGGVGSLTTTLLMENTLWSFYHTMKDPHGSS